MRAYLLSIRSKGLARSLLTLGAVDADSCRLVRFSCTKWKPAAPSFEASLFKPQSRWLSYKGPHRQNNPRSNPSTRPRSNPSSNRQTALAINKQLVELGKAQRWRDILNLYAQSSHDFNNVNYSTAISQLGRMRNFDTRHPVFLQLLNNLAHSIQDQGLEWIGTRQLANILHAIAKLSLKTEAALQVVAFAGRQREVLLLVEGGTSQEVANTAWACATLGIQSPHLFQEINQHATKLVNTGKPQEVANMAWACATLGFQAPHLFDEINQHAARLVSSGNAQDMANMAWACATLGIQAPNLFQAIHQCAAELVGTGTTQAVANTSWAFATLGIQAPLLFQAINQRAPELVSNGTPQAIANTAWACATLGLQAPHLFEAINQHAAFLVARGTPQAVSNTAWACASLGIQVPNLFQSINQHATKFVSTCKPQEVANTAWAFATLGIHAPHFFQEINKHATRLVSSETPQDMANLAWASATLGIQAPHLFQEINRHAPRLVKDGDPQNVANTAWACATLGSQAPQLFDEIIGCLESLLQRMSSREVLTTYYSLVLFDLLSSIPAAALDMDTISKHLAQKNQQISLSQQQVSAVLSEIGFEHSLELSPWEDEHPLSSFDLLSIDMANKGKMIAVEFDGPSHFLTVAGSTDIPKVENGRTKAKRQFLEKLGWKVVNVPYFIWHAVKTKDQQHAFMKELLSGV